jgi:hypothetical protein
VSIEALNVAWDYRGHPTKKLVLILLADHTNLIEGAAWPSIAYLAESCSISERTVQRAIAELEAEGWLVRDTRVAKSSMFYIKRGDTGDTLGVTPMTLGGDVGVTHIQEGTHSEPLALEKTEREEMFDSIAYVSDIDTGSLTKAGRGALNNAVKQLLAVEATPEMVRRRARAWRAKYPETALTPSALTKHWASLGGKPTLVEENRPLPETYRPEPPQSAEERAQAAANLASLREALRGTTKRMEDA